MSRIGPLVASLLLWIAAASAFAADRVALVVGMAEYRGITPLKNTVNDARAIAATLERIGFDVTTLINAPHAELRTALDDFAFRSETADLALVYFAGHGVEVQGENFLVPVDATVQSNRDIERQSVSLSEMLLAVDKARKMRIVILDSCRNNPFGDTLAPEAPETDAGTASASTRGTGGLAPPSPERGTLVAFAARDGEVALDGTGANSPFAEALIEKLDEPGLEISLMFRQVRDRVLEATGNRQEPHTYGSLSGVPFFLAGPGDADAERVADADRRIAWAELRPEQEVQLAALAETGDTRSLLGLGYIRLNPEAGRFDPVQAADFFEQAAEAGSPEAMFELAKLYENGIGVAQDSGRALALYEQSAGLGFADAINDLGFLYYQGGLGLARDPAKALEHFERAADLRHPQAMFNFAALIDDGLVPTRGPADAAGYLYDALRSGSTDVLDLLTERPTMFTDATRRALQARLAEHEFYTGSIDGDFGPGTQRGIRRAYGLTE
jgi:hypothetical protein